MKRKMFYLLIVVGLFLVLTSCAHHVEITQCVGNLKVYGFWNGLWHGMIAPFTFIGSLFNHSISVYGLPNNGGWYNFGFLLGVGAFAGESRTVIHKCKCK